MSTISLDAFVALREVFLHKVVILLILRATIMTVGQE